MHRISHGTMPLRNIFKVSELNYYFVLCSNPRTLNQIYVESYLDSLTYYSPSFHSRTVAITGALQLGWHTTLTTLSTPYPVSADHCNSHVNSLVEVDFPS